MKYTLIILSLLILLNSCEKNQPETITDNSEFVRCNTIKFFFYKEDGKRLFDLKDTVNFPVSFVDSFIEPDTYINYGASGVLYNNNFDEIGFDSKKNDYYWRTGIRGLTNIKQSRIYIKLIDNDIDTLSVDFRFVQDIADGIFSYAYINRLLYNDVLIRSGEGKSNEFCPENIIIKKQGGKTVITTEE